MVGLHVRAVSVFGKKSDAVCGFRTPLTPPSTSERPHAKVSKSKTWLVNKHLSLTAVTAQAIGRHLVGKTLNFMILQYIIVSGIITKIEFMHMKATLSLNKNSQANKHPDKLITRLSTSQTDRRQESAFLTERLAVGERWIKINCRFLSVKASFSHFYTITKSMRAL